MIGRLLLCLLFLSVPFASASPVCFDGVWQFDQNESDSLEKVRGKLARQEKMKQKAAYRQTEESDVKVMLPAGLPDFVFREEPLLIHVEGDDVVLTLGSSTRTINTAGVSQSLSLKNLGNQNGVVIAAWESDHLVIDTTTESFLIEERYQLLSLASMKVSIRLVSGDTSIQVEKLYWRQSPLPPGCSEK